MFGEKDASAPHQQYIKQSWKRESPEGWQQQDAALVKAISDTCEKETTLSFVGTRTGKSGSTAFMPERGRERGGMTNIIGKIRTFVKYEKVLKWFRIRQAVWEWNRIVIS